ncbi:MAG: hypothetical protein ACRCXK_06290 [Wohlfahrtiimonas sp.]
MKKYIIILLTLILAACSSVQPRHKAMDNNDLITFTECSEFAEAKHNTSLALADLQRQKKAADVDNALNSAGMALSLNPLNAFDFTRTTDLDETIKNYTERLDKINELSTAKKCPLPATTHQTI